MIMTLEKDYSGNGSGTPANSANETSAADLLLKVRQGQRFCLAAIEELEQILSAYRETECDPATVEAVRRCALAQLELSWALGELNEIGESLHEAGKVKNG